MNDDQWLNSLRSAVEQETQAAIEAANEKAANRITQLMQSALGFFYSQYKPKQYRRTYTFRDKSYRVTTKAGSGRNVSVTLYFGPDFMGSPYKLPTDEVFGYASKGLHGAIEIEPVVNISTAVIDDFFENFEPLDYF